MQLERAAPLSSNDDINILRRMTLVMMILTQMMTTMRTHKRVTMVVVMMTLMMMQMIQMMTMRAHKARECSPTLLLNNGQNDYGHNVGGDDEDDDDEDDDDSDVNDVKESSQGKTVQPHSHPPLGSGCPRTKAGDLCMNLC